VRAEEGCRGPAAAGGGAEDGGGHWRAVGDAEERQLAPETVVGIREELSSRNAELGGDVGSAIGNEWFDAVRSLVQEILAA